MVYSAYQTTPTTAADSNTEQGKALFLAGLAESCEFTDLHEFFEPFGKVVLCRVLKDAKTGRSRRVGYVNFASGDDAVKAMNALQGKPGPGGAPFDIKIAAQDPTFKPQETRKVFVRYVPLHVTTEQMRAAFGQFGDIEDCVVTRDLSRTARREPGPWNMAYVTYVDTRDAVKAVAEAAKVIRFGEQELTVKPAVSEETLRLRSKTRQQAAKQQQQQQQRPVMAPGGVPPGAIVAPPGMVPVMIPGVGLAFMPMQQMQQQQPLPQPGAFQPQQQMPGQFVVAQQPPQYQFQSEAPAQQQPQFTATVTAPQEASEWQTQAPASRPAQPSVFGLAVGRGDRYVDAFAPCAADQHLEQPRLASRRESTGSQVPSIFCNHTGASTPTCDGAEQRASPSPQWMS